MKFASCLYLILPINRAIFIYGPSTDLYVLPTTLWNFGDLLPLCYLLGAKVQWELVQAGNMLQQLSLFFSHGVARKNENQSELKEIGGNGLVVNIAKNQKPFKTLWSKFLHRHILNYSLDAIV